MKILDDTEADKFQASYEDFITTQRARIDSVEMAIVTKTKEIQVAASSSVRSSHSGSGHTYLKKQDPPSFKGDILDFPDFKRRWASQVHSENLEELSELDRLRDNIPESAKKMLVGEKFLVKAWDILSKLYGNKTMLANKLKAKLKNVKVTGKEDHDVVINLAIEVKSIVKSLEEMKMQEMLKHDDEYLSAIFRALPTQHRNKWLEFDKDRYDNVWEAMESFIEDAHEKATNTKVLLSNYAASDSGTETIRCKKCQEVGHKKWDCPKNISGKVAAARATIGNSDSDDDSALETKRLEERRIKVKDSV